MFKQLNLQILHLCLFSCFFLVSFHSSGQKVKFSLFNTDNGLSGNNTSSVTQDDRGFLWFINEGILHRYDGKYFLPIKPKYDVLEQNELLLGIHNYNDSLLIIWSEKSAFLYNPLRNSWKKLTDSLKDPQYPAGNFASQRMGTNHTLINRAIREHETAQILSCTSDGLSLLVFPPRLQMLGNFNSADGGYFLNYWCDIGADGFTYLAYHSPGRIWY